MPRLGRVDKYELVRELGACEGGSFFLARDPVADSFVSLRGFIPELKEHEAAEAEIRAAFELVDTLHHPHIVTALALPRADHVSYADPVAARKLHVDEGSLYLVESAAPGEPLSSWREGFPNGRVPFERALVVVRQIASALDYAHAQRILHGGLSPAAVRVEAKESDAAPVVRVRGFGLDAQIHQAFRDLSRGGPGAIALRPYRAPEQWRGEALHRSTDQYALAAMFVELVTGEVPFAKVFRGVDPETMAEAVCSRVPRLADDCPRLDVVLRALAKDPQARFSSCSEFALALEDPSFLREAQGGARSSRAEGRHAHGTGRTREERSARAEHEAHSAHRTGRGLRKFALLLLVAGGLYGATRMGWIPWDEIQRQTVRFLQPAEPPRKESDRPTAEAQEAVAALQAARVRDIETEIETQQMIVDAAVTNLQKFLETEGPSALMYRRDDLKRNLERTDADIRLVTGEVEDGQKVVRTLVNLRSGRVSLERMPSDLLKFEEIEKAHAALLDGQRKLDGLLARYTPEHPELVAQKKAVPVLLDQFNAVLDSALGPAREMMALHKKRLAELRAKERQLSDELEQLEGKLAAAEARKTELEQTRERESRLLADLRRLSVQIRFGAPTASAQPRRTTTNAVPAVSASPSRTSP